MPNTGIPQTKRFDQPLPINGRSIYGAIKDATLPVSYPVIAGAQPSGYTYHGALVAGRVGIEVTLNVESVDRGRLPSPDRFYLAGQSGKITSQLQEYQPEMVALAANGEDTLDESDPTFVSTLIGGRLGSIRRVLVTDDPDVGAADGYAYKQFVWTSPRAQAGATFSLQEEKAETVLPMEYNLNTFEVDNTPRLLEFRAYLN